MACFDPIPGVLEYVSPGKRRLKLHANEPTHWIGCGKCLGCKDEYAAKWALRLKHESRSHSHNTFLTLTYDEEHAPTGLNKKDLQDFWKRLRKQAASTGLPRIKYFACGEYGDRTRRPHYHAAVFGLDRRPDSKRWDLDNEVSETLNNLWGMGRVLQSELTTPRMAYVTGYVLKKAGYKKLYCDEDGVELQGPFQVMSTGLGKQWVNKYAGDLREGWTLTENRKVGIPRYYTDLLKKIQPDLANEIQEAKDERRASLPEPDPARLRAARTIREQKIKQRLRDRV